MLENFENLISFYASTIIDFLMSEPICYIMVAVLSCFVIKIIMSFKSI